MIQENHSNEYNAIMDTLNYFKEHPESMDEFDKSAIENLRKSICKVTGQSEHLRWCVKWTVEKWNNIKDRLSGCKPYEVVHSSQNIILDNGANEILKLICGVGGKPFNHENSRIYVGDSANAESSSQTGVLGTRAYSSMEEGFPIVNGRTITFRGSFDADKANFAWNEISISNGYVSMNRKVPHPPIGVKNGEFWVVQVTISLLSS